MVVSTKSKSNYFSGVLKTRRSLELGVKVNTKKKLNLISVKNSIKTGN